MGKRAHVVGYTWADESVALRVRYADEPNQMVNHPLGEWLKLRVEPGRFCTGYFDGKTSIVCPTGAQLRRGQSCETCASRDAFRPCMTCDGFRCPRLSRSMEAYCTQAHHLYLACFGQETLKVGTASDPRRTQRIIEQGPLAAARVAKAPGPTIKQIESILSSSGFTETMRRSKKTALLDGGMTEVHARNLILDGCRTLKELLPARYHGVLHSPVFVQQPELARKSRANRVNVLPVQEDRLIEGALVGAIGHIVFLEDDAGRFALDLGALKTRRVEFDPAGEHKRTSVQLGLF